MLATIATTEATGDQLWMRIMAPPACGKSTLCEALSVNKEHIVAKSTMRGFHSGFGVGGEDHSLISQLAGKTLIIKDGDALLTQPNLPVILAEGRDVYDTVSRTSYRTSASRDYEGLRLTWLLCGTDSLRSLDNSELGERFLNCIMIKKIEEELENKILWAVAEKANKGMGVKSDAETGVQSSPETEAAMRKTGGFVNWVRYRAISAMEDIQLSKAEMEFIINCALLIAFLRARPSERQNETASREMATRLTSQLIRLINGLCVITNRAPFEAVSYTHLTLPTIYSV